jgi:hypothetical protein
MEEIKKKKLLIIQDGEPDDLWAMTSANIFLDNSIPFFILVVAPDPKTTVENTRQLFEKMNTKREFTIVEGAKYGREIGIVEPEDQSYVKKLDDFIMSEGQLDVLLITTCYGLMKHYKKDWDKKINIVYHMGGLNAQGGLGFNWRVGKEWIIEFLKIPAKKIILETGYYTKAFKEKYNTASITPTSHKEFMDILKKSESPVLIFLKENMSKFTRKMLETNPESKKFYKEEEIDFSIGPSDVIIAMIMISIDFQDKKFKTMKKIYENLEYESICDIDWKWFDASLGYLILILHASYLK